MSPIMCPCFFKVELKLKADEIYDTFVDVISTGFTKGVIFVNNNNLGRFWKLGPQKTLYLPGIFGPYSEHFFTLGRPLAEKTSPPGKLNTRVFLRRNCLLRQVAIECEAMFRFTLFFFVNLFHLIFHLFWLRLN